MKYSFIFWFVLSSLFSACQTSTLKKTNVSEPVALSKVELLPSKQRSQYEAKGTQWMISTQGMASSNAGVQVIQKGGNLFDAFAAISFAIGVERPHSTGIGGGGFVLFYHANEKKVYAFDFRETAPRKAHAKMFLKADGTADPQLSRKGGLAVATPGHVAGVLEVHQKYGKLKLKDVLQPAIHLAEKGFPVYPALKRAIDFEKERLAQFPSSKKIFLTEKGEALSEGQLLVQRDLAETLKLIAAQGAQVFYQGSIAQKMAQAVAQNHGIMDATDLKNYRTKWRDPVQSTYRGFQIFSQPPPSSGGTHVIQILNILEGYDLKKWGPQSAQSIHLTASAMQRAFYDRAQFMGDPDFETLPTQMLISKDYATKARQQISLEKATDASQVQKIKEESPDTTHFSLMDGEGNVIASTQTINGYFGSGLVAEGTGIVLNNEMDDFAAQVGASNLFGAIGGKNNLPAPNKRPLSSMSPTIVLKEGQPVLAVGTPSGTRIITCVAQTLLNVLEYQLPLWESVTLTRYHQQWQPNALQVESSSFPQAVLEQLKQMGHQVLEKDLGCRIQAIQKTGNSLHGVSDPREEGSSLGL